jgi:hypothetical protein
VGRNGRISYATLAILFAVLAVALFLTTLGLNYARIKPLLPCPPSWYSLTPATDDDNRGVLRVVDILTGATAAKNAPSDASSEVAIGQPVCVVVAGAAPASSLLEDRDSARRKRDAADGLEVAARLASNAAAQDAASAQVTADASKRNAKPTADADQQAATSAEALAAARLLAHTQAAEGLADAQRRYDAAIAAAANVKPVDATPFLDGRRAPQATRKLLPIPGPQLAPFDFGAPTDASTPVAEFWRNALVGAQNGSRTFALGLARGDFEVSETAPGPRVTFRLYDQPTFWAGVGFVASLIACIGLIASQTTLLRANDAVYTDAELSDDQKFRKGLPKGPWSLGRAQMALWMVIVLIGFVFFWLALGEYQSVINSSILVLLGLNATTGLLAVQLDSNKTSGAKAGSSFYMDWISDGSGPQLQRIQVILWTVVLAFVFLYNVIFKFTFPAFDTNLLLLLGIAQATYIGFKVGEPPKGLDPKTVDPQSAAAGVQTTYTIKGANLSGATRAEFVLGAVTTPGSPFLSIGDEAITLTAKLDTPGDWIVRVAAGSDTPIEAPQKIKVTAPPAA